MAPGPSSSPPLNPSAVHLPPAKRPKLASNPLSPPAMSPHQYSPSPIQYPQGPQPGMQQVTMIPQQQNYPQQQMQQMQQMPQMHQQSFPQQQQQQQQQPPPPPPPPPQQQLQNSSSTSMPPPTAPASKATDPNDLADALTSAGIDLKEEEAKLASFSAGGGLSSGSFHNDSYPGVGSQEDIYRQAVRRQAESKANHLNDPFLDPQVLSNRLFMKTRSENLQPFHLGDLNGNVISHGANADLAALLSLACKERLNHLITRGAALAKARRRPQGQIIGEWANHVSGGIPEIKAESAVSPGAGSLKRSFSIANNLLSPNPLSGVPVTTLPNEIAKALRALKQKEWEVDQERQRKKARREQAISTTGGSGPGTPGASGDAPSPAAAGAESDKKMTAKESRKHQASKIEEQMSHRAANATANMMMGGLGGKKKKKTYSWMSAGGSGGGQPPMGGPRPGTPGIAGGADISVSQASAVPDTSTLQWTGQRIGVWREEGDRGKNIQIRDWVGALEGDGRLGGKSIVKAYLRMK